MENFIQKNQIKIPELRKSLAKIKTNRYVNKETDTKRLVVKPKVKIKYSGCCTQSKRVEKYRRGECRRQGISGWCLESQKKKKE